MGERSIPEMIAVKRDGGRHDEDELRRIVGEFVAGRMTDYQMSAWLMAGFINGLDADETVWLTEAMALSGRVLDLSEVPGAKVDKHSTGGVGDKTTLVLGPVVASCSVPFAKMSGRGLGHTGGTLDKLESIPGYRIELDERQFVSQLREVGVAVICQSSEVAPADKRMYALRDVTGTVPSVPLIVSSILSKKMAGGADAVLIDVKAGSGAFMRSGSEAESLARELERVGGALGLTVECVISDMEQPLGHAVGNALEVREAVATLSGHGPADLTDLCVALGARLLMMGGRATDEEGARERVLHALSDGSALETFRRWVAAQGGDPSVADDPHALPLAPRTRTLGATVSGWVSGCDAERVGRAAAVMGAGRQRAEDAVDPGAGLVLHAKVGDRLERGAPMVTLHAATDALLDAGEATLEGAVTVADEPVEARSVLGGPRR